MIRTELRISGLVQGVFYRQSARQQALALGLSGWVRNLPDGSVLAQAQGPPAAVEAFVRWCRQGPPQAQVSSVIAENQPLEAEETGFAVLR
ncbi:MAG: acylphosphatase [Bacteroidia bacterium]|nr:acylphosphatase [Bacteroidia bacterium]